MPKIIRTITGTNGIKPWIAEDEYATKFTEAEIAVINSAKEFTQSLAGFVKYETIEDLANNKLTVELYFDTEENMHSAIGVLHGNGMADIIKQKNLLIKNKLQQMNVESVYAHSWE